ncbi:hypothetical protein OBBRIDRAFT_790223 [Obba rivulosa]|uniref:Uncharacterized protein n=1 Tax=Obba rivulosa TaxID=1052685 RepID=A0A8E2DPT8_9APHY|nr:hypothetical protein OBBRIDRAFT_790223 [Obba rivulosa]
MVDQPLERIPQPAGSPPPYKDESGAINAETDPLLPPGHQRRHGAHRRRRLCFTFSAIVLLVLGAHVLMRHHHRHGRLPGIKYATEIDPRWTRDCVQYADWVQEASDSTSDRTSSSDHFAHVATTSFELPLSSDLLYLISRGALSHGDVHIDTAQADSDMVAVNISMSYDYETVFEQTKVCLLQPAEGRNGVGIFSPENLHCATPNWNCTHYRTNFEVWLRIPTGLKNEIPAFVKSLETDMSLFSHRIYYLQDTVFFDSISLKTSNSHIVSGSLAARQAVLRTSNGRISGVFNTSSSLHLGTSNAPIDVDVRMLNADNGKATELNMRTSNSRVDAVTELISTTSSGTNGIFKIDARTSNSPLDVSTKSAPVDHVLYFTARTSNAPASASLHSTWEGAFRIQTSQHTPTVDPDTEVPDPKGKERRRDVVVRSVRKGVVEGSAAWTPKEEHRLGEVKIRTSNAPLKLRL